MTRHISKTFSSTNASATLHIADALEEMLDQLSRVGKPTVALMSCGWYAYIEMHTAAAGAEFKVHSDFDHATPTAAVDQLRDRVRETIPTASED